MSKNIRVFLTGLGLDPQSADPSSPIQGQIQYADGTARSEGLWRYDGVAWQQAGSAGGGLNTFFQEDFETNGAADFTTGNNAAPDAVGTGTLDGAVTDETSSQLKGDSSLKYTMGATSTNDFFLNDVDITTDVKEVDNNLGIDFFYTYNGDDDDIRFFILDQDDNELTSSTEYIKSKSTATRFSTSVYIPSGTTGIRYGFQVVTGNSAKVFIVDDLQISHNPFVYKNLLDRQYSRLTSTTTFGNADITGTLTEEVGSGLYSYASGTGIYTALKDIAVTVSASFRAVGGGKCLVTILVDGTQALASDTSQSTAGDRANAGARLRLAAGQTFKVRNGAAGSTNEQDIYVHAEADAEHVVTPSKGTINSINLAGNDGRAITANTEDIHFSGSGTGWTSTGDTHYYTVQYDNSIIDLSAAIYKTAAVSGLVALYKNGTLHKSMSITENESGGRSRGDYTSSPGEFAIGDQLSIRYSGSFTLSNSSSEHFLVINEVQKEATYLAAIPTTKNILKLVDGVTAPDAIVGTAQIYVDAADGDLKVKFGDGITKTLATDT